MTNPLISVVTPCYNAEKYIGKTIESVINQTYQNWEMLVIDDCSTDNSANIVKDYERDDSRIRYIKMPKPSGSPAYPRNVGINESKGEYVAFLDSDDLWLPHKLQSQLDFICKTGASFVYSYCSRFVTLDDIGGVIKSPAIANYNMIKKRDYIPMLTILLKKDLLQNVRFEDRPKEDYVFLLRLFATGITAYNTNESVALYRIVKNSRSSNKISMFYEHYLILRGEGFNPILSFYYTCTHCMAAILKYSK